MCEKDDFYRKSVIVKKKRFGEYYSCFRYETKTGIVRILVIFQHRPVQPHK